MVGYKNTSATADQFRAAYEAHLKEVKFWRAQETYWDDQAATNPDQVLLFKADDTETIEVPRAGRQGSHELPSTHFKLKVHK